MTENANEELKGPPQREKPPEVVVPEAPPSAGGPVMESASPAPNPKLSGVCGAIIACMREIGALGKDSTNKEQGWNYRSAEAVYNRSQPLFARHGIFSVPKVLNHQREKGETRKGTPMFWSIMEVEYTFFHKDGSSISCVVTGEGMDTSDKASSKAQTMAHKKAICQILNIPYAVDDPDAHTPVWSARDSGRVTFEELNQLKKDWLAGYTGELDKTDQDAVRTAFADWVVKQVSTRLESCEEFDPLEFQQWPREAYEACQTALEG